MAPSQPRRSTRTPEEKQQEDHRSLHQTAGKGAKVSKVPASRRAPTEQIHPELRAPPKEPSNDTPSEGHTAMPHATSTGPPIPTTQTVAVRSGQNVVATETLYARLAREAASGTQPVSPLPSQLIREYRRSRPRQPPLRLSSQSSGGSSPVSPLRLSPEPSFGFAIELVLQPTIARAIYCRRQINDSFVEYVDPDPTVQQYVNAYNVWMALCHDAGLQSPSNPWMHPVHQPTVAPSDLAWQVCYVPCVPLFTQPIYSPGGSCGCAFCRSRTLPPPPPPPTQ